MKLIIALFALAFSQQVHAQVLETSEDLVAQAGVTKDGVSQFLRGMSDLDSNVKFQAKDYAAASAEFKKQSEAAMIDFQAQVKIQILDRLAPFVSQYNAIAQSNNFTADQKTQFLNQQLAQTRKFSEQLNRTYSDLIRKLYALPGIPLLYSDAEHTEVFLHNFGAFMTDGHSTNDEKLTILDQMSGKNLSKKIVGGRTIETTNSRAVYYGEGLNYTAFIPKGPTHEAVYSAYSDYFHAMNDSIIKKRFMPALLQGCESQSCVMLKASLFRNYLMLVKQNLDRPLLIDMNHFSLIKLDGAELVIQDTVNALNQNLPINDLPIDSK